MVRMKMTYLDVELINVPEHELSHASDDASLNSHCGTITGICDLSLWEAIHVTIPSWDENQNQNQEHERERVKSYLSSSTREEKKDDVLPGRLPPIAVKLKGDTATWSTNPSKAQYSTRLKKCFRERTASGKKLTSINQGYSCCCWA